jgi:hypothetical protein
MVSPRVSLVVVSDLRNPESARGNQQDCCVVEEDILLSEVNNEPKVDAKVENEQFSLECLRLHYQVLIVNFKGFLQEPHFEHKGVQKVCTTWKLKEVKTSANANKHEVLPKKCEVPDNENGEGEQ